MAKILVVEDDPTLGLSLRLALKDQGHHATVVRTLAGAREALADDAFDLVLLDLGLPDGDGVELCRELRAADDFVPLLAVTARTTLDSRVEVLGVGADDYITKPFDLPELLARIDAHLRRRSWPTPVTAEQVEIGRLVVDFGRHEATCDGEPVALSDLELRLLRYLLSRRGRVVSRETLLTDVWDLPAHSRTRTIDTFVYRLRRLIEPDPAHPRFLVSLRGAGYRLEAQETP